MEEGDGVGDVVVAAGVGDGDDYDGGDEEAG